MQWTAHEGSMSSDGLRASHAHTYRKSHGIPSANHKVVHMRREVSMLMVVGNCKMAEKRFANSR